MAQRVLREWFWRGDTVITIFIEQSQKDNCIVNAESRASHHRLNATLSLDASKREIAHYFNFLDQEYKLYLNKNTDSTSQAKTLENKLGELKQALEKNLISKSEYEEKRKKIIDEH